MYAAILNNPEFANILMNLLAQKGLDPGDTETSGQLLDLLKSNPDFLKGFLTTAPEESVESESQPVKSDEAEVPQTAFHEPVSLDQQLLMASPAPQLETLSMETQFAENTSPVPAPTTPKPAQIPLPGVKIEGELEAPAPRPAIPIPVTNKPVHSMPAYISPTIPVSIQQLAGQDRVQALGFPPMMFHSHQ
jgi:hypothetical protein